MKKVVAGFVALLLFLSVVQETKAASDIKGNYFEMDIKTLIVKGIMEGYKDGSFRPNKDVTRAEFAKLIVESLNLSGNKEVVSGFTDVHQGAWYFNPVQTAVKEGILNGYPDNTFQPNKKISRQEMAAILTRAIEKKGISVTPVSLNFKDTNKINQKVFLQDVSKMVALGIMNGNSDNTFRPHTSTTRGQVAAVLTRMLKVIEETSLQQNAKQRIMVNSTSTTTATVQLQQLEGGKWVNKSNILQAVIGKNGVGKRIEGDGKTPTGTFALGTAFGWGTPLQNLSYPFRKATSSDYWVDDVNSKEYNQWISYSGDPKKRWASYEKMNHRLYKYGVVIRYNEDPIVAGKGSAIFLHMKESTTKYTQGCIALNEADIKTVIKWLDKNKNPIIIVK